MGLLFGLLTLPVLGAPRLVQWLAQTIEQATLDDLLDEGPLHAALLDLQEQLDAGALGAEEYDRQEREVLDRLNLVREMKAQRAAAGR